MLDYTNIHEVGDNEVRYALTKQGTNPLIVIALNPSVANEKISDRTVDKIRTYCELWGFDSFIMLNLYPLRQTHADQLPRLFDETIHQINLRYIEQYTLNNYSILMAYGDNVRKYDYLSRCLNDIFSILSLNQSRAFYQLGNLTKKGNPRHPSRLAYNVELQPFNFLSCK